jgi:hypothetical protein
MGTNRMGCPLNYPHDIRSIYDILSRSLIATAIMPDSEAPFWKRWSLLKQRAGTHTDEEPSLADSAPDLPDLDTLRALFRQPEFAVRDGLDDYDGDYRFFEPRGELLTYDMRWASERTRPAAETVPESEAIAQVESSPENPSPTESTG